MFYKIIRLICYLIIHLFWSMKIEGEENINHEGPLILAANHVSYLDPVVLGVAFKRKIYFIAKKEIFEVPILAFLGRSLDVIPVDRKKLNPASIKKSLSLLETGHVLGIFPEGTRSSNGELLDLNAGLIKIALKANSPIIPVGLKGTFDIYPSHAKIPLFLKRKTIYIRFGKPIYLDNNRGKDIEYKKETLLKIQDKIKELTGTTRK